MRHWRWIGTGLIIALVLVALEMSRPDQPQGLRSSDSLSPAVLLVLAAGTGDSSTVAALLEQGVDVDAKDPTFGHTALIVAARMGHIDIVRALLDKGAHVEATDNFGFTALYWAKKNNVPAVVELLKQAGATEPKPLARYITS